MSLLDTCGNDRPIMGRTVRIGINFWGVTYQEGPDETGKILDDLLDYALSRKDGVAFLEIEYKLSDKAWYPTIELNLEEGTIKEVRSHEDIPEGSRIEGDIIGLANLVAGELRPRYINRIEIGIRDFCGCSYEHNSGGQEKIMERLLDYALGREDGVAYLVLGKTSRDGKIVEYPIVEIDVKKGKVKEVTDLSETCPAAWKKEFQEEAQKICQILSISYDLVRD